LIALPSLSLLYPFSFTHHQPNKTTKKKVREEIFRYDVTYICDNMNWKNTVPTKSTIPNSHPALISTTPPPLETIPMNPAINAISQKSRTCGTLFFFCSLSPTFLFETGLFGGGFSLLGSAGQGKLCLVARDSFLGHTGTIFCMAYDEVRDRLISAGKDNTIFVWTQDGKQREKLVLPSHYACALDINSTMRSLYICGVSKSGPAIISYSMSDKGNLVEKGVIDKSKMKLVSCVKVFAAKKKETATTPTKTMN
jgi:WD40 repeat protein